MERWKDSNRTHTQRSVAGYWCPLLFVVSACITPAPVIRTPDIVEIDIPMPVMAPFDCTCQCQPHKALEIVIEDIPVITPGSWYPPTRRAE